MQQYSISVSYTHLDVYKRQSIPLSVIVAVVLMYFTDITLNIISMSGLVLGIGMLVDN